MNRWWDMYIRTKADELAVDLGCYIDPRDADRVKRFAETHCRLFDGRRAGQFVEFIPWVWDEIVFPLYAWKRADGTRRFRDGSIWTPRKQSKTTTLAVLSLYQLLEEPGAQVYVLSSGIKAAKNLYEMAEAFVLQDPALSRRFKPVSSTKIIRGRDRKNFSKLEVLSADKSGKSGQGASCVFVDETAEITDDRAWRRLRDSGSARTQPIWLSISTPSFERNGLAWSSYCKARSVIQGKGDGWDDIEYLAVIKGVPDEVPLANDDGSLNEEIFNYIPSLGLTVTKQYYYSKWKRAQSDSTEMSDFKWALCGQWTDSAAEWIPFKKVQACMKPVNLDELKEGEDCYIGIDGADNHLSSLCLWFPKQKIAYPYFFHPEDTAKESDEKKNTKYQEWAAKGYLTLTDGNLFDFRQMEAVLKEALEKFNVLEIGFDHYGLNPHMSAFQEECYCPCTVIYQNPKQMTDPLVELERLVQSGEITLAENPILEWNFACATLKRFSVTKQILIDRDKSSGRYDGLSALACAIHRDLANTAPESVYNSRGIISF